MRISYCDDNPTDLAYLSGLLDHYAKAHPTIPLHLRPFQSCNSLWSATEAGQSFDLCLLTASAHNGINGIELAERLSNQHYRPQVVFLHHNADFAVEAFRVRAKHYLLKPLDEHKLFTALDEIVLPLSVSRDQPVTISTVQNSRTTVPLSSIIYTECNVHTIRYHMSDGATMDSRSIRVPFATAIAELLESGRFIQPHRSFAVNMEHIVRLSGQELVLRGNIHIPISRLRLSDCRSAYQNYLLNSAAPL